MDNIIQEIKNERKRQDEKWGEQNHAPIEWIAILTEEVGEASKAALEGRFRYKVPNYYGETSHFTEIDKEIYHYRNYRKELIQVAAVAIQMIESLDRNELS